MIILLEVFMSSSVQLMTEETVPEKDQLMSLYFLWPGPPEVHHSFSSIPYDSVYYICATAELCLHRWTLYLKRLKVPAIAFVII